MLDRETYIPAYLVRLASSMSGGASRVYLMTFGIGVNEWRILSILALEPGATAQAISNAIDIDKAAISRGIRILVDEAYIAAPSPGDSSRNRPLFLTEAGRRLHDKVLAVALTRERILLDGFSPEERSMLVWMLRRLGANLDKVAEHDAVALSAATR